MKRLNEVRQTDTQYGPKALSLALLYSIEASEFRVPDGYCFKTTDCQNIDYKRLTFYHSGDLIVRSSMLREDSIDKSYAGVADSIHCHQNIDSIKEAVQKVRSSMPFEGGIIVQRYVDAVESGEFFTIDPDTGSADGVVNSHKGNGGTVAGTRTVKSQSPSLKLRRIQEALEGSFKYPMDIEWVWDGNKHWVVQVRPITGIATEKKAILHGRGIASGFASGKVLVVTDPNGIETKERGYILVAPYTNRKWEHLMVGAAGLITDHGTNTCHSAIFARELGLPAVIGCESATKVLQDNDKVHLDTISSPAIVYKEYCHGRMSR
jgi:phosphoenolpyruvate synthase/pyruvate phosphate dikinase